MKTLDPASYASLSSSSRRSDVAYSKLRHAILEGQLAAGTRLVELELSKSLQMGRTPIHDALLRLMGDGLVDSVPNAGFFVRHLTLEDIEIAYEVRFALESVAVRLACRHGFSEVKLDEMESVCDLYEECMRKGDPRGCARADFHFHQLLILLANSPRLESIIRSSHLQFFTWSRSIPSDTYLKTSEDVAREHRRLIELLRKREAVEAERFLSQDLSASARERVREFSRATKQAEMLRRMNIVGELGQDRPPSSRNM